MSSFPQGMPSSDAPFVDLATGRLTIGAYRFMLSQWNRTGGAVGVSAASCLQAADNLADLANPASARANLGLGTAATQASSAFATAGQGALAASALQPNTTVPVAAVDVGGQQVVGPRQTGWGTPTGAFSRAALNTGSTSLTQVAETLGALIADLSAHGLIGP